MAKITSLQKIVLSRYRQFEYLDVPLTGNATGENMGALCLLGLNGIGKSTLLQQCLLSLSPYPAMDIADAPDSLILTRMTVGGQPVWQARSANPGAIHWFETGIESAEGWSSLKDSRPDLDSFAAMFSDYEIEDPAEEAPAFLLLDPQALDDPELPGGELESFLFQLAWEKEEELQACVFLPENSDRTVADIETTFLAEHPSILPAVEDAWNEILGDLSLRFFANDEEARIQSLVTGQDVPPSDLSPAIQRVLVQIARLTLWMQDSEFDGGFLVFDTPEEGLHPTTVLRAMKTFRSLLQQKPIQLLAATNSPLVATLFDAGDRLRLSLDTGNRLICEPGVAPKGANPNQILSKDFSLPPLNGPKAPPSRRSRSRSSEDDDDRDELADLIDEVMSY